MYTPAVLQGEPPPWAHPTPSPSPMIRFPGGPDALGRGGAKLGVPQPPVSEELLWAICHPFINDMIMALRREIQRAIQTPEDPNKAVRSPSEVLTRPGMGVLGQRSTLGGQMDGGGGGGMPFGSLLNPSPPGGASRPAQRRDTCEPLHEELDTHSAQDGSPLDSPLMPGVGPGEGYAQKVPFARTSKSLSPIPTAADPTSGMSHGGMSSRRASPALQGLEPSMQSMLLSDASASQAGAGPVFLLRSEQNQRLTPTVSPQLPLVHNMQQGSPVDLDGEKSVMVCRHWKSKGWCRLEDQCKFLHPDSKRGAGVPPKKGGGAAGGKEGAGHSETGTPPGAASNPGEGTRNSRPSRRAGRGRNNRGQNSGASAAGADGSSPSSAMAPGLVGQGGGGNSANHQQRHDDGRGAG